MTSDVVIRVAGDADVAALARMRAMWAGGGASDAAFVERMASWMATEGERRTIWLAVVDGRPAGMVSLFEYRRMPRPGRADSRWGYVGALFVREDSRNRGIGSALLAEVVAAAEERSYARLAVSPSAGAVSLFRRAGFVVPDAGDFLVRPAAGSNRPHGRAGRPARAPGAPRG